MPPSSTKATYLSKTLWTNAILAACAFFPGAETFITTHPQMIVAVLAGVNFALRLFTKDKLTLAQ